MERAADLRDQAEALAVALEVGLATVGEVIAWADAVIERATAPPAWICEVALMRDRHALDVAGALREAPGARDRDAVDALTLERMRATLAAHPERVVRALYELRVREELPDLSLDEIAIWADDALDLADAGLIVEDHAGVYARVLEALADAALAVASRRRPPS